ncbi:MAG: DHH family phosphoesterase, partial [Actinobacteria bacterium]|nr:DHH family phosphoesterase [Actinomycetota bacterium]
MKEKKSTVKAAGQKKIYGEIARILEDNKNFLVITHVFPDGDALGSISALHVFLKKINRKSFMICNSDLPYQYKFLPFFNDIKRNIGDIAFNGNKFACFCLDCADEERMNLDFDYVRKNASVVVNIDHHRSNNLFGHINMVDSNKSATAEMVYDF